MYTNNKPIMDAIKEKGILIAAHRGTCGANVVQNTCLAYKNSLLHGADMIEVDAFKTTDGIFYAFHNGEENLEFGFNGDIRTMSSEEVEQLRTLNSLRRLCIQRLERLEHVLETFRGKCLINIDRTWFYWKEIIELLDKMNMNDQILLKSAADETLLKELEEADTGIMYMPIMYKPEELEIVKKYNINVAAAELIIPDLDCALLRPEFMGELKKAGIPAWVNAITLTDDSILSGELDDNKAIRDGFEESWGRLVDMGFEIIQTDWPALVKNFRDQRGL